MVIAKNPLPTDAERRRARLTHLERQLREASSDTERTRLSEEVASLRGELGREARVGEPASADEPSSAPPPLHPVAPHPVAEGVEVAPGEVVPKGEVPPGEVVPRGEIPPADVVIARDEVPSAVPGQWDVVDEASWESFPASDPPSSAASAGLPDSAHPREEPRRKAPDGSRGGSPK